MIDGIIQYQTQNQKNQASPTQVLSAGKEAIRPTSAYLQELTPGKVFEGIILEIKDGQVTIGLNDGQTMTAHMEKGVVLAKGMPVLFEVKSGSGEQIVIRPVTWESPQNPTLLKALEAAGMKPTYQNLTLVSEMMKAQMPVDRNSLLQMARLAARFPKAEVQTLIQMQQAGIEINDSTILQFENYKSNQQSFLPKVQELMEGLPKAAEQIYGVSPETAAMTGGQKGNTVTLLQFQQQLAEILTEGQTIPRESGQAAENGAKTAEASREILSNEALQSLPAAKDSATESITIQEAVLKEKQGSLSESFKHEVTGLRNNGENLSGQTGAGKEQPIPELLQENSVQSSGNGSRINHILSLGQQANLTALLQKFSGAAENSMLFQNGQLNQNLSAKELLLQIVASIGNSKNYDNKDLQKLFFSKEYKEVLKQAMEEQWLTAPENLTEEGAIKELYQRMGRQMERLQQMMNQTGTSQGAALAKSAQSVQSNLEFINQLNQMYTYIQLPLKLQNQNAHSDLYVYTNKKSLMEREGELTALLHLDMEHLGAADIHIKMLGSAVETKFYLGDRRSCDIILNHLDWLQVRLEEKGYQCSFDVENREKKQDFVEEFLEKERPKGLFQRYSFDVKA